MALPLSVDESEVEKPKPCALCKTRQGLWLVFGERWFCSGCCDSWAHVKTGPEPIAEAFEKWFKEVKTRRSA